MTGRPLMGAARRVRVQVVLDPTTLEELDAARGGMARSQAIESAVRTWLAAAKRVEPRKRPSR